MKHLLITGASGVGKTTLLLNRIAPVQRQAAGFVTQRMMDSSGGTCGFCLTPADTAKTPDIPFRKDQRGVFIRRGEEFRSSVFLSEGLERITNTDHYSFILLDEIGGVELLEPAFFFKLTDLFLKAIPCIGVLKSRGNLELLQREIGYSRLLGERYETFYKFLSRNPQVEIVQMEARRSVKAEDKIQEFLKQLGVEP